MPTKRCKASETDQEHERQKIREYDPVQKIQQSLESEWTDESDYEVTQFGVCTKKADTKIKEQEIKLKANISLLHKIVGNLRHKTVQHKLGGLGARSDRELQNTILGSLESSVEDRLSDSGGKGVVKAH